MHIILIGNYPRDRQESMERFARMLENGFASRGDQVEIWRPVVFFGIFFSSTITGAGKWLGYLDKWILFPIILFLRSIFRSDVRYHICDHSNAFYLNHLPKNNTSITCHDVLAIRGALGFSDAYCPASATGKLLQKWILSNLLSAKRIACVSLLTLNQLKELAEGKDADPSRWQVIHNAYNGDFSPVPEDECHTLLEGTGLQPGEEFILHVGSRLPRKNRKMLLDMVHALGDKWNGRICYAGNEMDKALYDHAVQLGLENRVVSIKKPAHKVLTALYSSCYAFIFPSFSEGFGWPVIEAQACGAPVIASNIEPMPEVSGGAALHADPYKPEEFAAEFLKLENSAFRSRLVNQGFTNTERFAPDIMIKAYLSMFNELNILADVP